MSYNTVVEQLRLVPNEYLDDISRYISNILNGQKKSEQGGKPRGKFAKYFGTMDLGDGLEIQKQMRDEWD